MKDLSINSIEVVNGGCWECFACFCKPKIVYVSDLCSNVKPIYISKMDVISDGTLRQIFEFNSVYEKLCGDEKTAIL
jgi:hypothetical protein